MAIIYMGHTTTIMADIIGKKIQNNNLLVIGVRKARHKICHAFLI
ncbi:hypothetical protein PITCH_A230114 [uncultured Desulfobacterium sp.]|uniref:Uncharacterized protein n=1 Tax=uncultured Desulfobacterium sp. TaxID=201089 RepID=A0A445MY75_9BACT|nr:hypothetical protein PITCH_A230114 [uncultured Desulfobacterium sp.]